MALSEDYLAVLERLALVCERYRALTRADAVLVGGAATAIYTSGVFPSGDFDFVAGNDAAFANAVASFGFRREDRPGFLKVGYYHPDHPGFGFQQVSGRLFDGKAEPGRLVRMIVTPPSAVMLPSMEDMIADRMGQYAVASPTDDSRLRQARMLFKLAKTLDTAYLRRRILDEGGDPSLLLDGQDPKAPS
jgi:hypothetical protein